MSQVCLLRSHRVFQTAGPVCMKLCQEVKANLSPRVRFLSPPSLQLWFSFINTSQSSQSCCPAVVEPLAQPRG